MRAPDEDRYDALYGGGGREQEEIEPLAVDEPADWDGLEVPAREWVAEGWLPLRQCTLLAGKGGVGKSLLAQQLSTCIALGLPFLGIQTRQMGALYLSCEDDRDELHRRQITICAALGVSLEATRGKLFLRSLSGDLDNQLCTFDPAERLITSARYAQIEAITEERRIGFIGLDNASHLMAGDHNSLHQVAAFVGLLNRLAVRCDGASLILHHPNKAGDDWLGSVAWENQVRSRIKLGKDTDALDSDMRYLENPKANYSAAGGRIDFRWFKGAFSRDDDRPRDIGAELSAVAADNAHSERFMACLKEMTRQRRAVSEKVSSTYAPKVFERMAEARGSKKRDLILAMERLFRIGAIERSQLWKGPDRKPVFGLRETAGDLFEPSAGDPA